MGASTLLTVLFSNFTIKLLLLTTGLLLSLLNNINTSSSQVKKGLWYREENRGFEIEGKTVAIIGMGNTGKNFAKKISGFNCKLFFYDIDDKIDSKYAKKSSLDFFIQIAVTILSSRYTDVSNEAIFFQR